MHQAQEQLTSFKELDDETLLDTVLLSWQTVCEENEAHRELVTPSQFNQWEGYRDNANKKMEPFIESFEGVLSAEGRETLEGIAADIIRASHKGESELLKTALADTRVNSTEPLAKKKRGWLGIIRRIFGK